MLASREGAGEERDAARLARPPALRVGIANESDQATKEHSVDALAARGDEGRGTLR